VKSYKAKARTAMNVTLFLFQLLWRLKGAQLLANNEPFMMQQPRRPPGCLQAFDRHDCIKMKRNRRSEISKLIPEDSLPLTFENRS